MARARPVSSIHPTDRILGSSPAIDVLRAQIRHLAPFDAVGHPVGPHRDCCMGETGTGKGLVARSHSRQRPARAWAISRGELCRHPGVVAGS